MLAMPEWLEWVSRFVEIATDVSRMLVAEFAIFFQALIDDALQFRG